MSGAFETVYDVIEIVVPLVVVAMAARTHRPAVALAWIASTLVLPVVTLAAYLYFNGYRLRQRARRSRRLEAAAVQDPRWTSRGGPQPAAVRERQPLMRVVERSTAPRPGGNAAVGGNAVELLERPLERLAEDIDAAREHVHLLYYVFAGDDVGRSVGAALGRAAARGVDCRLLAGSYASHWEGPSLFAELAPELRRGGVQVVPLAPLNPLHARLSRLDIRNHRKVAVIDGRIGHVGSKNVHGDEVGGVAGAWHDLVVRLEGPVVAQLQGVFAQDWLFATDEALPLDRILRDGEPCGAADAQVLAWGPSDDQDSPFIGTFVAALADAQREVVVTSPYFVPDEAITVALAAAARRGVTVKLLVPRRTDRWYVDAAARACVEPLLRAGVEVWLHEEGVLHAKSLTVDERVAMVGSANCDSRSSYLNFEAAVLLYDEPASAAVRAAQQRFLRAAIRIEPEPWFERGRPLRTLDHTATLLAALL